MVLHLACGLDSRAQRVDVPDTALWYDVDLPAVMDLRRELFKESTRYRMIAASVVDRAWLDQVPGDR